MNVAIICAAGKSERMGSHVDKAFISLGTRPVLAYSLDVFESCEDIDGIVLVVRKDRLESAQNLVRMYGYSKVVSVVTGGRSRALSVAAGLAEVDPETSIVVVHDACRPCLRVDLLAACIKAAKRYGCGLAAFSLSQPLVRVERGLTATDYISNDKLWQLVTPQAFRRELLETAVVEGQARIGTADDVVALLAAGTHLHLVESNAANMALTCADDLPSITAQFAN